MTRGPSRCACGWWSGVRCDVRLDDLDGAVEIETMPFWARASHAAARNRGTYSVNGAVRLRVSRACAALVASWDGDWSREVAP